MNNFARFVPAIIPKSFEDCEIFAKKMEPYFKFAHIDVVDASYRNETWFEADKIFMPFEKFTETSVHLMVQDPILFLNSKAKTLKKENITYLVRSKFITSQVLQNLKTQGFNIGIFYEIGDLYEIDVSLLSKLDEILFLLVLAGDKGRESNLDIFPVINKFYEKYKCDVFENLKISIDGGLNNSNIQKYIQSKADKIYANSFFNDLAFTNSLDTIKNL